MEEIQKINREKEEETRSEKDRVIWMYNNSVALSAGYEN